MNVRRVKNVHVFLRFYTNPLSTASMCEGCVLDVIEEKTYSVCKTIIVKPLCLVFVRRRRRWFSETECPRDKIENFRARQVGGIGELNS